MRCRGQAAHGQKKEKKAGGCLLSRDEPSIIGVRGLDFRVRNGNGYFPSTMAAGILIRSSPGRAVAGVLLRARPPAYIPQGHKEPALHIENGGR